MEKLLNILKAPNKNLYKKAQKVTNFDQNLYDFAQNMLYTLKKENGCGLASNQVEDIKNSEYKEYDNYRAQPNIFIILISNDPIFIINAEILKFSEEKSEMIEGCLSIPEFNPTTKIIRPNSIKVQYQNLNGDIINAEYDQLLARVFQHEFDHNQGILFPNRLSKLKEILFWKKYLNNKKY